MPKSSSKQFSIIDARHWFEDRCAMGVNDNPLRGPGIICSLYLLLVVIGIISSTGMSIYQLFKNKNTSKLKLTLFTALSLGWSIIALNFMYTACYICNGIRGFILLFVLGMIVNFIMLLFFKETVNEMIFMFENKNIK